LIIPFFEPYEHVLCHPPPRLRLFTPTQLALAPVLPFLFLGKRTGGGIILTSKRAFPPSGIGVLKTVAKTLCIEIYTQKGVLLRHKERVFTIKLTETERKAKQHLKFKEGHRFEFEPIKLLAL
jgi:hypothetical protein